MTQHETKAQRHQDAVTRRHLTVEYLRGRDHPCPECGYNLRGIGEPKCPECGLEFIMVLTPVRPGLVSADSIEFFMSRNHVLCPGCGVDLHKNKGRTCENCGRALTMLDIRNARTPWRPHASLLLGVLTLFFVIGIIVILVVAQVIIP